MLACVNYFEEVTLSLAHQNEHVPPLFKSCEVKSKNTTQYYAVTLHAFLHQSHVEQS